MTLGLLAVISAVLAAEVLLNPAAGVDRPTQLLGLSRSAVLDGEWWRLLTASLVNPASGDALKTGAIVHWLMNAIALWKLGPALERRCSPADWGKVAVVSAVVAEGWLIVAFPHSTGYGGGTSVVVVGMAGALVSLAWRGRRAAPRHWTRTVRALAIFILVSLLAALGAMDPAVNQAHLAALVTGLLMGAVLPSALSPTR